jgi:hypothetical protein
MNMAMYTVRIAIHGMTGSWLHTKVGAASAARAIEVAEARETAGGYTVLALRAENERDAHDVAAKGKWPFKVTYTWPSKVA